MSIDYTNPAIFAYPKPPKTEKAKRKPIVGKKHKQTKQKEIPKYIKLRVWIRDKKQCIFCHKTVEWNYANAHYIPRSAGGLGIEENIFTACEDCHREQDNGKNTKKYDEIAERHLKSLYKDWTKEKIIYKK